MNYLIFREENTSRVHGLRSRAARSVRLYALSDFEIRQIW